MRVLVADSLPEDVFRPLAGRGVRVEVRPELDAKSLPQAIRGVKVLVVRSTEVTRAAIQAADQLSLIVRAGSGTNTIDVAAASAQGIYVANCPGKNSVAVAELTLGLILALDRRIAENVRDLRQGTWNKGLYSKARGLKGRQLGIVGFGAIGREVAQRARSFGMRIVAHSRNLTDLQVSDFRVDRASSLEALFETSDVVSLHLPLTKDTRGLVGRALLERMKKDAVLINTARAEIVDSGALCDVVARGHIRVGADVFVQEPEAKSGAFEDPLGRLPGVYGTHHIGASTEQAQAEIASATARIVERFLLDGEIENVVNILLTPPAQGTLVIRHLDRVGVLASVLSTLKTAEINVETMDNVIFAGGVAACARIRIALRPSEEIMTQLRGLENVLNVELI